MFTLRDMVTVKTNIGDIEGKIDCIVLSEICGYRVRFPGGGFGFYTKEELCGSKSSSLAHDASTINFKLGDRVVYSCPLYNEAGIVVGIPDDSSALVTVKLYSGGSVSVLANLLTHEASTINFNVSEEFTEVVTRGMYGNYKKETRTAECEHEWKPYQGLTQSYDYCTKCDEKKK